ncbi:hypothetical protein BDW66DRAFT_148257 [Aspergillus desertorum]
MTVNDKSTFTSSGTGANDPASSGTNGSASYGASRPTFNPSLRDAVAVVNGYAKVKAAVEAGEGTTLTEEEARDALHALGIQLAPGEDASTKLKGFAEKMAKTRGSYF